VHHHEENGFLVKLFLALLAARHQGSVVDGVNALLTTAAEIVVRTVQFGGGQRKM
jgi:hypothetical protein